MGRWVWEERGRVVSGERGEGDRGREMGRDKGGGGQERRELWKRGEENR